MTRRVVRAQPGESLTMEEMRRSLPSIFAADAHDSRSDRYIYISTEDMLGRLMAGGFLPVEARTALPRDVSRTGFAKHLLRFRSRAELAKPDNSYQGEAAYEVILRNAHDGTGSYGMYAGLIRYVCENGLVVADGTVSMIRVMHTGHRQSLMDRVLAGAQAIVERGPAVADKIKLWRDLELDEAERAAFAKAAHQLRFGKPDGQVTMIKPEQLIVPRRTADVGRSLWSIFNVVQENAVRGGLEGRSTNTMRRITTRSISSIDDDLRINRQLWELAEKAGARKLSGKRATDLELV
jgi:Domain of unknown function (DUF932)